MFRDPPHYLKPLKTTTTPKRLLWLACRGQTKRKADYSELRFQAAALGRTWWTARKHEQRNQISTYDDPAVLWADVASFCPQGRKVVLFAYDLAEQMRLAQLLTCLPALGWQLDKIVLERSAAWCLLRDGKRSLMCCDLKSWLPVDFGKIVTDLDNDADRDWTINAGPDMARDSAVGRVHVIRSAVLQILAWIEGENLGPFRPTGSGQSYSAYRRRFIGGRLLVHDDIERLTTERRAMHTGRAEVWRHGSLREGPFVEYDLHAAYATIGRDCDVPTVARGELAKPAVSRVLKAIDSYAVLADVTVTTGVECVPYKIDTRTMWPVGTLRTQLWDPELMLAFEYADKVTVHKAWLYRREPALHDFCAWVLDRIDGHVDDCPPIARRVLKHWSRCMIGRLGLRFRAWHDFGPQDPPDVRLDYYTDWDDGTRTDMLLAGNRCMLLGELTEATESLPQIPGWVMSECRRRLWDVLSLYNDRVVYCDTDSVILSGRGNEQNGHLYCGYDYGTGWVPKGVYDRLTIHGPRNIEVGSSRRVSGLPVSALQVAPLEFTGEVMRGVKLAMRNGELDCVVSIPRTFHLEPRDLRRRHVPDGKTAPYEVEEH